MPEPGSPRRGPGGEILLPVCVRWDLPLGEVDEGDWRAEHRENIVEDSLPVGTGTCKRGQLLDAFDELEVEQVTDDARLEFAGLDFGIEELEVDYGLPY